MNYKLPKLRDHNGDITKRWAIFWYTLDDSGKWERHVEWLSNKIENRKARYLAAEKIISEITLQLTLGKKEIQIKSKEKLTDIILNALEFKKRYVSKRTYDSYENIAKKLIKWINRECPRISYDDFTSFQANRFIDELFRKKKYEAKTINTIISYLHIIFTRIGELYPIGSNPFKIRKLIENEPEIPIWGEKNKTQMAQYLKANKPEMFIIILLVYHCFLRPNEIRLIQVRNINLLRGTIKISARKGKGNHVKYPTMSTQLIEILAPLINGLDPETYLFSKGLKPGKQPISRNMISMSFKKIREKLKISSEFKLYHFKHTGNSEMIEKGLNIRELQSQNGHSSLIITEKYLRRLNDFANLKIVSICTKL